MAKYTYEIQKGTNPLTGEELTALVRSDGALIPQVESNSDYQQYLIDTDGGLN